MLKVLKVQIFFIQSDGYCTTKIATTVLVQFLELQICRCLDATKRRDARGTTSSDGRTSDRTQKSARPWHFFKGPVRPKTGTKMSEGPPDT